MSNETPSKPAPPTDYEALNNTFYSIVDSWLPADFGQKAVRQTDADVLVKIRKAKEKERHRASNTDGASSSSIPHANLLKRKLQSNGTTSKDAAPSHAANDDAESSEEESRTRSIAKKSKTGFDAFSKPSKGKAKGKQRDDGSGVTAKTVVKADEDEKAPNASSKPSQTYQNPFAMPSSNANDAPSEPTPEPTPPPTAAPATTSAPTPTSPRAETDGQPDTLTKAQRKKQRKKEKKALAREESLKAQQDALGKLAVGQAS